MYAMYLVYLSKYSLCLFFLLEIREIMSREESRDYVYDLSIVFLCINRRLWWTGVMKRNLTSS